LGIGQAVATVFLSMADSLFTRDLMNSSAPAPTPTAGGLSP